KGAGKARPPRNDAPRSGRREAAALFEIDEEAFDFGVAVEAVEALGGVVGQQVHFRGSGGLGGVDATLEPVGGRGVGVVGAEGRGFGLIAENGAGAGSFAKSHTAAMTGNEHIAF